MRRALAVLLIGCGVVGAFLLGRRQHRTNEPQPPVAHAQPGDPEAEAWAEVHASPSDPNAWAELGDAQSAAGDLIGAEHSYNTALRMGGDNGLAYARLGFLHYQRNEDDRALALLVEAKQRGADVPMLDFTIEALRSRDADAKPIENAEVKRAHDAGIEPLDAGEGDARVPDPIEETEIAPVERPPPTPPAPAHDGVCSIPAKRIAQGRTFVVTVALYGHWAELIIDTGASITVVTRAFADAVQLPIDPNASFRAITANGRVELGTAVVPEVVLADRVARDVRVAICDSCVETIADGLLGLDLVAAFGMRLDLANETVYFADCD